MFLLGICFLGRLDQESRSCAGCVEAEAFDGHPLDGDLPAEKGKCVKREGDVVDLEEVSGGELGVRDLDAGKGHPEGRQGEACAGDVDLGTD